MSMINLAAGQAPITMFSAVTALAFPPTDFANVVNWNGSGGAVPEFDLELWCGATSTNLSLAELYAGVLHPGTLADQAVTSISSSVFTRVAHGFETGDGPVRFTNAGGALPTGLAAATDYWIIKVSADTYKVATTLANALALTAVTLSTNGSGTQTLEDTADTKLLTWHSHGMLGAAGGGAVTLTLRRAYTVRCGHRPNAVCYGISATLSVATAIYGQVTAVIGGN